MEAKRNSPRAHLGQTRVQEGRAHDRRRRMAAGTLPASSASVSLTQNARENDREGLGASLLNHEARQGLDCGRAGVNFVNHCGDVLRFSARSE